MKKRQLASFSAQELVNVFFHVPSREPSCETWIERLETLPDSGTMFKCDKTTSFLFYGPLPMAENRHISLLKVVEAPPQDGSLEHLMPARQMGCSTSDFRDCLKPDKPACSTLLYDQSVSCWSITSVMASHQTGQSSAFQHSLLTLWCSTAPNKLSLQLELPPTPSVSFPDHFSKKTQ